MSKKIKSIILTSSILCSFTQTSLTNPKLDKLITIITTSGVFFGLTALTNNIIKKSFNEKFNINSKLKQKVLTQEEIDLKIEIFAKCVLISQI